MHRHRCNSFIPDDPSADHRHFRDKFTGPGALYGIWRKGAAHLSAADLIHAGAEISGHLPAVPGSAVRATLLSLIRDVIAFVPFTVLLPLRLGLDGILWAAPAADLVGLLFSILFIR